MKKLIFLLLALTLLLVSCGNETTPSSDPNEGLSKAYNFKMTDTKGNETTLKALNGKPIVLNFWASWCPPCKEELDDFENMYRQYRNKINFVMLSVDEDINDALALIAEKGYTFPVYHDSLGEGSFYYSVSSIPQTYFINSDGYVTNSQIGMISASALENGIKSIMK